MLSSQRIRIKPAWQYILPTPHQAVLRFHNESVFANCVAVNSPSPCLVCFVCLAVVSVEPTYAYYEKVSEEMELIVNQVKENEKVMTNGKIPDIGTRVYRHMLTESPLSVSLVSISHTQP